MGKRVVIVVVVMLLLLIAGCSGTGGSSAPASYEILKKTELASKWRVYQVRLEIPAGAEFPFLLKLADGDKVDGYFNLEAGVNLEFSISGSSQLYKSAVQGVASGKTVSDRFSFTASQAQGSTYVLIFRNGDKKERASVLLEVIYPISGAIFVPLEAK